MENMEFTSLVEALQKYCVDNNKTLATSESCTGGFISHKLTSVPGASNFYVGGIVCYSNYAKQTLLRIPKNILKQHTAVSTCVASLMATSTAKILNSDCVIATTGYASRIYNAPKQTILIVYTAILIPGQDEPTVIKQTFSPSLSRFEVICKVSSFALTALLQNLLASKT